MGFKQVQTLDADNVIALGGENRKTRKKNPTQVEGYYLGSREVDSKKAKNGKAKLHFFQTNKGNLGVWGKTDLDRKLDQVTPGTMVRATFTGMKNTQNGDMYVYKVEQDDENTIEVNLAPIESDETLDDNGAIDQDATEFSSDDNSDDDNTEDEDQEAELAAAAAREKRRAEVTARLGRTKKA